MDLFDTCTWANFIVETVFLGTPTIHFPGCDFELDTVQNPIKILETNRIEFI
jgi:hypothetical protein